MPWNQDENGKPKPSGDRGPWGGGPNHGPGNRPPDLDEMLNKGKDQLKSLMPGGGGRAGWVIPILALGAFWLFNSIYQVQPDERGLVLRLGAYNRTVAPGLHFAAWPVDRMEVLPVAAENQTSIGDVGDEGLMLTGDENMVDIKFKVLWKIADPQKFLFNISEQQRLVQAVAESAMREIVGRTPATEALTNGRLAIQDQVTEITQRTLDQYGSGIKITGLALEGVDPPSQVLDAFEEVQRAKQDQQKSINEAELYTNQKLRNADGDAAKRVEDAKGYKAQITATAKGEAQRFDQIYAEYSKAKDVTRTRLYLETMEKVLAASNKVILEQGKSGQGVVPYLPLPAITQGSTKP
jgi:modulator of FtsH protease HflK